ncbi:50S ribosomal protein L25 [Candidatus Azambacteria bacterium]|nr:50S ribosomal protein L25 [Candidatus Azambacteria bacterium]
MPTLKAQVRTVFGKRTKTLRKEGKVPAVIYGHGVQTLPLEVSAREFEQVYKEAGENTLLTLEITKDGKAEPRNVIIHEVVHDPLKDHVLHVDFYQVRSAGRQSLGRGAGEAVARTRNRGAAQGSSPRDSC